MFLSVVGAVATCFLLGLMPAAAAVGSAPVRPGIPAEADVLVVGGTVPAVAAARAAAAAGAKTYLVTPHAYLGEDVAGTQELEVPDDLSDRFVRNVFSDPTPRYARYAVGGLPKPEPPASFCGGNENISDPAPINGREDFCLYLGSVAAECRFLRRERLAAVECVLLDRKDAKNPKGTLPEKVTVTLPDGTTVELRGEPYFAEWNPHPTEDRLRQQGGRWMIYRGDLGGVETESVRVAFESRPGNGVRLSRIRFVRTDSTPSVLPPSPLHVKAKLDASLVDAKVGFLTTAYVRGLVEDEEGGLCGVEIAARDGVRTIRAKVVVDATREGVVTRLAEKSSAVVSDGRARFTRVVAVREDAKPDAARFVRLRGCGGRNQEGTYALYRCTAELPIADASFPALAAAEAKMHKLSFCEGILGGADLVASDLYAKLPRDSRAFLVNLAQDGTLSARVKAAVSAGAAAAETARTRGSVGKARVARAVRTVSGFETVVAGGGTSGVSAAIGAGEGGAKTLCVDLCHQLGGVGTEGRICGYVKGFIKGFTLRHEGVRKTVPAGHRVANKAETWRRQCQAAGVTVWFGALALRPELADGKVAAVEVETVCGPLRVPCLSAVDATGNSDLAVAAGAPTVFMEGEELAIQSAGKSVNRLGGTANSDFGYMNDSDPYDAWLFALRTRAMLKGSSAWDISSLNDTRERRRIMAEHFITGEDAANGRTYPDVICRARSHFDTHGPASGDLALVSPADSDDPVRTIYLPLRSILPRGVKGLAVVGLGTGCDRDVMTMVRMQADLQNLGYAAGRAAALANGAGGDFHGFAVGDLQDILIREGVIPDEVRTWQDNFSFTDAEVASAAATTGDAFRGVPVVLANRERAFPHLRKGYAAAETAAARQAYAVVLGVLGDATGVETLVAVLSGREKPAIVFPADNSRFCSYEKKDLDATFAIALGRTKDRRGTPVLLDRLARIDLRTRLAFIRSTALALAASGDPSAAKPLAEKLSLAGIRGHAVRSADELGPQYGYKSASDEMDPCLRELALARALVACGDFGGLGLRVFAEYAADPRGILSAYAQRMINHQKGEREK